MLYNVPMKNGVYRFAENFMKIAGVIFTTLIFVSAFLLTAYNYDMNGHKFDIKWDNLMWSLISIAVIFSLWFLMYLWIGKNPKRRLKWFLTFVMLWYLFLCEYMAFFGRSMPNSDSWAVYAMAKSMANGDLSIIHPTGSYMSYYPQQIGICTFLSLPIRLINMFSPSIEAFHFLLAGYGIMEVLTVFFMYKTVANLFNDDRVCFIFLYLSLFNFPYIMYSSYLYGEIPALLFLSMGSAFLSAIFAGRCRLWVNVPISVLSFALAVFVRKNSLIFIVGILIVLAFEFVKDRRMIILLTAVLIGISAFSVLPITIKYYENKAGNSLTKGVTALSYVAMGMQESKYDNNAGWYNGFNFDTFETSGCNVEKANEISEKAIKERIAVFKGNPAYAFSFYREKFITQWVDGTYFSRESTHNYYGNRSDFLMKLYYGEYSEKYIFVCNIFQSVVFLGAFIWSVLSFGRKRGGKLWQSFLFVGIFGGFLFHMIWEANSRYILTYATFLIIYSAAGYSGIKK